MTKYNHLTNSAMQFSRALERCHSGPYISAVHAEIHFNHAVAADFKICMFKFKHFKYVISSHFTQIDRSEREMKGPESCVSGNCIVQCECEDILVADDWSQL